MRIDNVKNKEKGIEIGEDFQGWPIYKRNLKWIIEHLGGIIKDFNSQSMFTDIIFPTKNLEQYPQVLEDDGMGYSPNVKYISDSDIYDDIPRIWIDKEDPKYMNKKMNTNDDSYSALPWPEVQDFFNEPWFKDEVCFDSSKNLWFIPNKYIN